MKYQIGDRVVISASDHYPGERTGTVVDSDEDHYGEWYDVDCGTTIRRSLTPMQLRPEEAR